MSCSPTSTTRGSWPRADCHWASGANQYLTDAQTWYQTVLGFGDVTRCEARARCLYGAGTISFLLGEQNEAQVKLEEGVAELITRGREMTPEQALVVADATLS